MPRIDNNLGKSLMRSSVSSKYRQRDTTYKDSYVGPDSLADYMAMTELANMEFSTDHNLVLRDNEAPTSSTLTDANVDSKEFLKIPRRPPWSADMTADELQERENKSFLQWRRHMAKLETTNLTVTPFEKNLDFWRELWRVVERSDLVVQLVDARHPLLYHCADLDEYVRSLGGGKQTMVLANKADLLTEVHRKAWADYFEQRGMDVVFWSALGDVEEEFDSDLMDSFSLATLDRSRLLSRYELLLYFSHKLAASTTKNDVLPTTMDGGQVACAADGISPSEAMQTEEQEGGSNGGSEDEANAAQLFQAGTVGLVGYPNVGKSSSLNLLLGRKRAPVSATPGRTRHLQTSVCPQPFEHLTLADCPGLVTPSLVTEPAELYVAGILSADRVMDCVAPIALICERLPTPLLECFYNIDLSGELAAAGGSGAVSRPSHAAAERLLDTLALQRGYISGGGKGRPDQNRAARRVLKDYLNGRLLYCNAPPHISGDEEMLRQFESASVRMGDDADEAEVQAAADKRSRRRAAKAGGLTRFDDAFFVSSRVGFGVKAGGAAAGGAGGAAGGGGAGAGSNKKHGNRNKKEKLRRQYGHLDQR